jgi:hypothetical protein
MVIIERSLIIDGLIKNVSFCLINALVFCFCRVFNFHPVFQILNNFGRTLSEILGCDLPRLPYYGLLQLLILRASPLTTYYYDLDNLPLGGILSPTARSVEFWKRKTTSNATTTASRLHLTYGPWLNWASWNWNTMEGYEDLVLWVRLWSAALLLDLWVHLIRDSWRNLEEVELSLCLLNTIGWCLLRLRLLIKWGSQPNWWMVDMDCLCLPLK